MDNNYFASGQFIIETEYPDWENLLHVMLRSFTETTEYPDRTQNSIDLKNIPLNYEKWVLEKVQGQNIPIESISADQSWFITYNPYGYQGIHNHTNKTKLVIIKPSKLEGFFICLSFPQNYCKIQLKL